MTAIRLCLVALLVASLPLTTLAQAQTTLPLAESAKPSKAEIRAKKKVEIAKEKATMTAPNAEAAMATRKQIKEKRNTCKAEAKVKNISLLKRRSFMKECEAG
jgi:hypothetical protein